MRTAGKAPTSVLADLMLRGRILVAKPPKGQKPNAAAPLPAIGL